MRSRFEAQSIKEAVRMLDLFATHGVLRRMYYAAVAVAAVYALPDIITAIRWW